MATGSLPAGTGFQKALPARDTMPRRDLGHVFAVDAALRRTLTRLGVKVIVESSVLAWHGDGATIVAHLDGCEPRIAADCLVTATTHVAMDALAQALRARGAAFHEIGDGVAPRQAPQAVHAGRKLAPGL